MKAFTSILFLLSITGSTVLSKTVEYTPTIELAAGKLRGKVIDVENYGKVDAFVGIRYVSIFEDVTIFVDVFSNDFLT